MTSSARPSPQPNRPSRTGWHDDYSRPGVEPWWTRPPHSGPTEQTARVAA